MGRNKFIFLFILLSLLLWQPKYCAKANDTISGSINDYQCMPVFNPSFKLETFREAILKERKRQKLRNSHRKISQIDDITMEDAFLYADRAEWLLKRGLNTNAKLNFLTAAAMIPLNLIPIVNTFSGESIRASAILLVTGKGYADLIAKHDPRERERLIVESLTLLQQERKKAAILYKLFDDKTKPVNNMRTAVDNYNAKIEKINDVINSLASINDGILDKKFNDYKKAVEKAQEKIDAIKPKDADETVKKTFEEFDNSINEHLQDLQERKADAKAEINKIILDAQLVLDDASTIDSSLSLINTNPKLIAFDLIDNIIQINNNLSKNIVAKCQVDLISFQADMQKLSQSLNDAVNQKKLSLIYGKIETKNGSNPLKAIQSIEKGAYNEKIKLISDKNESIAALITDSPVLLKDAPNNSLKELADQIEDINTKINNYIIYKKEAKNNVRQMKNSMYYVLNTDAQINQTNP